jgi:hypothetical protein
VLRAPINDVDSRKLLVDRVAQSRYIGKSARLHDLLVYLCSRVIEDGVEEIHEQEVGHDVFGRPKDYNTAADNIVRVHASTLRKRLEQYFSGEGRGEPVTIGLPKGNYAPLFRQREPLPEPVIQNEELPKENEELPKETEIEVPAPDRRLWMIAALAIAFACSTVALFWRLQTIPRAAPAPVSLTPAVKEFWSAIFRPGLETDIVLDDAALGLYQELSGRPVALSEYFDRSYLRRLGEKPAPLDRDAEEAIVTKRQTGYANAVVLWPLSHTAASLGSDGIVHFARDYSFRALRSNRAILLGTSRSNPWIQPFDSRLGMRWESDSKSGLFYPVDSWAGLGEASRYRAAAEHPDGYCSIALLPNLGGTANVVILSGTGGSAMGACAAFLMNEDAVKRLKAKLTPKTGAFPSFEALLKIPSRSRLPHDAEVVIGRAPR